MNLTTIFQKLNSEMPWNTYDNVIEVNSITEHWIVNNQEYLFAYQDGIKHILA